MLRMMLPLKVCAEPMSSQLMMNELDPDVLLVTYDFMVTGSIGLAYVLLEFDLPGSGIHNFSVAHSLGFGLRLAVLVVIPWS